MRIEDIHIGDVLRVREWDDMEAEFGLDSVGDIPCPGLFVRGMEHLCGKIFTVEKIISGMRIVPVENDFGGWLISADMLEPIADKEFDIEAANKALAEFLSA